MIAKMWNRMKENKKNNRGAAMIMVIVSIAFIGMLVAMIVYMAYYNYLMKGTDRAAKNNFYSAETALDVINAGLQSDISTAMSTAYVTVMQDAEGQTANEMTNDFQTDYFAELLKTSVVDKFDNAQQLCTNPSAATKYWNVSHLTTWLEKAGMTVSATPGTENSVCIYTAASQANLSMIDKKDYITLENVKIVYTDEKGYVSIVETDIRIKTPDLDFAVGANKLQLDKYSIIANKQLVNDENHTKYPGSQNTSISGSVYGGLDGIYVKNNSLLDFKVGSSGKNENLIAGTINVDNAKGSKGVKVDNTYINWVENVNVRTGNVSLNGESYVADDITIDGSESSLKLSGKYYGYGNSLTGSEDSSSILINGARTALDFSNLDELFLSGHAYVGTRHYDADADRYKAGGGAADESSDYIENIKDYTDQIKESISNNSYTVSTNSIKENTTDVLLGESISVKANQLIYMVPTECIGYDKVGNHVIAKNPMSYDEYRKLTETYVMGSDGKPTNEHYYTAVDLSKLWTKLGGSYTNKYKAVFRRVNGSVLVYLYLDFGADEENANEFFKAYYKYDPAALTTYVKSYVSSVQWNRALNSNHNKNLSLAGNAFYFSGGDVVFQEDTITNDMTFDKLDKSITFAQEYDEKYQSLLHSLTAGVTSTGQLGKDVYTNLVGDNLTGIGPAEFKDATGNVVAYVTSGDFKYDSSQSDYLNLIVASGDVCLKRDFTGLVIAGGNVYIGAGCNTVKSDSVAVIAALRAVNSTGKHAYEVFGVNGQVSYAETTGTVANEYIDLGELIVYQNWKKE